MNDDLAKLRNRFASLTKQAASDILAAAEYVADKFDELPISPANVADRVLDAFIERRTEAASADSRWAEIEARRHNDGGSTVLLFGDGLTFADWETQKRIEQEITPDPWWLDSVRLLRGAQTGKAVRTVRRAGQRITRGWDETSTWDLGSSLTMQLADQLEHLAATSHGYPGNAEFPSFESWAETLMEQARALRRHSGSPEHEAASEAWLPLAKDEQASSEAIDAAQTESRRIQEADKAAAAAAMHWVADHLDNLWD